MAFENASDESKQRKASNKKILQRIELARRGTYFYVEDAKLDELNVKDQTDYDNLDALTKGLPSLSPVRNEGKQNKPMDQQINELLGKIHVMKSSVVLLDKLKEQNTATFKDNKEPEDEDEVDMDIDDEPISQVLTNKIH